MTNLRARGYTANFDNLSVDEGADAVTATRSGTIRLFYNLTPPVTVACRRRAGIVCGRDEAEDFGDPLGRFLNLSPDNLRQPWISVSKTPGRF